MTYLKTSQGFFEQFSPPFIAAWLGGSVTSDSKTCFAQDHDHSKLHQQGGKSIHLIICMNCINKQFLHIHIHFWDLNSVQVTIEARIIDYCQYHIDK